MKRLRILISKLSHYIGISIDWIGRNISRIKTIGLLLLFILFIMSFISNGCNREQANRLFRQVTGLDLQNDILSLHNRTLKDSLNREMIIRRQLEYSKALLLKEKDSLIKNNKILKKRLAGIPEWLLNMPADSSYKFLNEIAYPYPGKQIYPFNEPQIKNIHKDYLENIQLTGLVVTLENQLINCEKIGDNADSLRVSYMKSYNTAEKQKSNLEKIIVNTEEKADLYKNELDKNRRRKGFWKVTSMIETVVILILAL